jgi:hypothetical protein
MAKPSPLTWLPLWQRALDPAVEIGIGFTVSGCTREYFKAVLYEARKQSKDPRLQELIMFLPNNGEIWICKKSVEMTE